MHNIYTDDTNINIYIACLINKYNDQHEQSLVYAIISYSFIKYLHSHFLRVYLNTSVINEGGIHIVAYILFYHKYNA